MSKQGIARKETVKKILIINGPNLNMLGLREPHLYGNDSLAELETLCHQVANELNLKINFRQTNHEGVIVDWIQEAYFKFDGIIINPAAYTHSSIAILDALKILSVPIIEVHLTDISKREEYRKKSYVAEVANHTISGQGTQGYITALKKIAKLVENI